MVGITEARRYDSPAHRAAAREGGGIGEYNYFRINGSLLKLHKTFYVRFARESNMHEDE